MLRSILIALSRARWAQQIALNWGLARRVALRFVAGVMPEDAIRVVRQLNERGILASVDHLGENTTTQAEAEQAAQDVLDILDRIQAEGVHANVSIKLSQLGMVIDPALCCRLLERILQRAQQVGNFIRIDMEDSPHTSFTLDLYRQMRQTGYEQVGVVIQSYLYRSADDVDALQPLGTRVRLCKGAYLEPASVAYPAKADVDANFDRLTGALFSSAEANGLPLLSTDGRIPPIPALATHDEKRIDFALAEAHRRGLPPKSYEFQMLYGIRRDLQERLAAQGHSVRVYVPYGSHWYPYFMRRLAERPANLWFILSNFFRR